MNLTEINKKYKEKFGTDLTQEQAWGIVALYAGIAGNEKTMQECIEKASKK